MHQILSAHVSLCIESPDIIRQSVNLWKRLHSSGNHGNHLLQIAIPKHFKTQTQLFFSTHQNNQDSNPAELLFLPHNRHHNRRHCPQSRGSCWCDRPRLWWVGMLSLLNLQDRCFDVSSPVFGKLNTLNQDLYWTNPWWVALAMEWIYLVLDFVT